MLFRGSFGVYNVPRCILHYSMPMLTNSRDCRAFQYGLILSSMPFWPEQTPLGDSKQSWKCLISTTTVRATQGRSEGAQVMKDQIATQLGWVGWLALLGNRQSFSITPTEMLLSRPDDQVQCNVQKEKWEGMAFICAFITFGWLRW